MDLSRFGLRLIAIGTLIAATVVPLVVKIKSLELPLDYNVFHYGVSVLDGFSWYKGVLVAACGAVTLLGLLLSRARVTRFDGACMALATLAIASALLSPFQSLGFLGVPYILEGLPTILAYLALAAGATRLSPAMTDRWLPIGIVGSVLVITIFGLAEAQGVHLINQPWLAKLLLETPDGWRSNYNGGFGAATFPFGNPNYAGMYAALIWPFLLATACRSRTWMNGLLPAIGAGAACALLIASGNRAGFIGAIIAVILSLLYLRGNRVPTPKLLLVLLFTHALAYAVSSQTTNSINHRLAEINNESPETMFVPPPNATSPSTTHSTVISVEDGRLRADHAGISLLVERQMRSVKLMDLNYRPLPVEVKGEHIMILDDRFRAFRIKLHDVDPFYILSINEYEISVTNRGFKIMRFGSFFSPVAAARFPLPLSDLAFSYRGYIWSRSLPLLADGLFLGHGPGAFPFVFPNNDPAGIFGASKIVDKPHCFYISFAFAHGVTALLILLTTGSTFFYKALQALLSCRDQDYCLRLLPYVAGSVGCAVAALATDSTIGVAAPWWVLFGCGVGILRQRPPRASC